MEAAKDVRLVIFDVDGVMTDGRIIIDDEGVETRVFDIKDGFGAIALKMTGVETAIITSRSSEAVRRRAEELKIERYHPSARNKIEPYEQMLAELELTDGQVCYVGDDLVDLKMMRRVGLPVAVADAVAEIREAAAYVTQAPGGRGAVREVAELILKAQGKWDKVVSKIG